jgi:hypothetical protein
MTRGAVSPVLTHAAFNEWILIMLCAPSQRINNNSRWANLHNSSVKQMNAKCKSVR